MIPRLANQISLSGITFLLSFLLLLLPGRLSGYSMEDSLQWKIDDHPRRDTAYVDLLLQSGNKVMWKNPERAKSWALQAKAVAHEIGSQPKLISACYGLGAAYTILSQHDSALVNLLESQRIAAKLGDSLNMVRADIVLAVNYDKMGEYHKALKHNFAARDYFQKHSDTLQLIRLSNNIGNIYSSLDRLEDALQNYQYALEQAKAAEELALQSIVSANIGNLLRELDRKEEAFPYLLASYRINDQQGFVIGHAVLCYTLGMHYLEQESPVKAQQFIREALQTARETQDRNAEGGVLLRLGKYFQSTSQPDSAQIAFDSALLISRELKSEILEIDVWQHIYEFNKTQGKTADALAAYERYTELKSKNDDIEKERQIKLLEDKYALEKQQQLIERLEAEAESRQEASRRTNWILLGLALALLLALILMVLFLRSSRKRKSYNRLLKRRSELIERQRQQILVRNEELSQKNKRLETLNNEIEGLVAIVAHDLRAPLTSTEAVIEMLEQPDLPPEVRSKAANMVRTATKKGKILIEDILTISRIEWGQPGYEWEEADLGKVLSETAEQFRGTAGKKQIDLQISVPDAPIIYLTERPNLERILENLISNAIKFSPPKRKIWLSASTETNGSPRITIRDEGPGISSEDQARMFRKFQRLSARPTGGESSTGLGLSIVKALVDRLGGEIHVHSQVGEGTTFTISFSGDQPGA